MTTPYAGNAASFPATVSLIDDGEPANAAVTNPPWQQLADRTAYLNAADAAEATARAAADSPLINFVKLAPFQVLVKGSAAAPLGRAVWNPILRRWYAVGGASGGNNAVYYSSDGITWVADAGPALGFALVDIDVNPTTGTMVVTTDGATGSVGVCKPSTGSLAWSAVSTTNAMNTARWNDVAGRWVGVGHAAGGKSAYATEANVGAAWTVGGTMAVAMPFGLRLHLNTATGTMVATQPDAGLTYYQAFRSTDGGSTWTAVADIAPTYALQASAPAQSSRYSATEGRWLLSTSDAGLAITEVMESTDDGLTWTFKTAITGCAARGGGLNVIDTPYGTAWLLYSYLTQNAAGTRNFLHLSWDGGTTWRKVPCTGIDNWVTTARATPTIAVSSDRILIVGGQSTAGVSFLGAPIGDTSLAATQLP